MTKTSERYLLQTREGMGVALSSLILLGVAAVLELVVAVASQSVSLYADALHNAADALSSLPLLVAFKLSLLKPSRRFTYGLGKGEDLAGMVVLALILWSAVEVFSRSWQRFLHPAPPTHLAAMSAAGFLGFLANEGVAQWRVRIGKRIGSAVLVSDGVHARLDGLASLGVVAGAMGTFWGFPKADSLVGLVIGLFILQAALAQGKILFFRLLDGVDPELVKAIRKEAGEVEGVLAVSEVRVRWVGHALYAEINVAVSQELTLLESHEVAKRVIRALQRLPQLVQVTVHIDPSSEIGEGHHEAG